MIALGGGRDADPYFWAFWWNGSEIRIETASELTKTEDGKTVRKIIKIAAPPKAYIYKDEMLMLISGAFLTLTENSKGMIITEINCIPQLKEGEI
ncbi:MAG: hypothetical protein QM689_03160 [Oscillospiraceae bacterium]